MDFQSRSADIIIPARVSASKRGSDAPDLQNLSLKSGRKPAGRKLRPAEATPASKLEHIANLPMDGAAPKPEKPYEKVQRTKVLLWHSVGYLVVLTVAWSEPLGRLFFDRQGGGSRDTSPSRNSR